MKENFGVPYLTTGIAPCTYHLCDYPGRLKRLAHVAQRLVPTMALIYVVGGLSSHLANITKVPGCSRTYLPEPSASGPWLAAPWDPC